eukprot:6214783-Pleurochrysis_carterae.AAC.7
MLPVEECMPIWHLHGVLPLSLRDSLVEEGRLDGASASAINDKSVEVAISIWLTLTEGTSHPKSIEAFLAIWSTPPKQQAFKHYPRRQTAARAFVCDIGHLSTAAFSLLAMNESWSVGNVKSFPSSLPTSYIAPHAARKAYSQQLPSPVTRRRPPTNEPQKLCGLLLQGRRGDSSNKELVSRLGRGVGTLVLVEELNLRAAPGVGSGTVYASSRTTARSSTGPARRVLQLDERMHPSLSVNLHLHLGRRCLLLLLLLLRAAAMAASKATTPSSTTTLHRLTLWETPLRCVATVVALRVATRQRGVCFEASYQRQNDNLRKKT